MLQSNNELNSRCFEMYVFYVFCWLTGLYWFDVEKSTRRKCCKIMLYIALAVSIVFSLLMNAWAFVFGLYIIIACPFKDCQYMNMIDLENGNHSAENDDLDTHMTIASDWKKVVFTVSATTTVLSNFIILLILPRKNFAELCGCCKEYIDRVILHPFNDTEYKYIERTKEQWKDCNQTTRLSPKEACYFLLFFGILMTSALIAGALLATLYHVIDTKFDFRETGLIAQYYSWLVSIVSCFIFSKVAYALSTLCKYRLFQQFKEVDVDISKLNGVIDNLKKKHVFTLNDGGIKTLKDYKTHLPVLKQIDREYVRIYTQSLKPYSFWFAFHWLFFIVSSFASLAHLIDKIEYIMYENKTGKCHGSDIVCRLTIAYTFFFTLGQCLLFLYPCFRAAKVTEARQKLIHKVADADWKHIPLDEKTSFIQFLKAQDCTFKASIMCSSITFNFDIAYLSIFLGVLSIILTLSPL